MAYDFNKTAQENAIAGSDFEFDTDKFRKGLADGVAKEKEAQSTRTSQTGWNEKLDIDWRARLQVMRANKDDFFGDDKSSLIAPLMQDRGIMFQYQPSIFLAYSATYDSQSFQGSNYPMHTFMNSQPPVIPIQVPYSATNQDEARYLLAMLQFLKVSVKAQFGEQAVKSGKFGRPPPVLEFSYLGPHGFDRIPVVVNDFNYILTNTVDYIPVEHNSLTTADHQTAFTSEVTGSGNSSGHVTYVPTDIDLVITVMPQYSPRRIRRKFDLDAMRKGQNIGFI
jgi:hypothetical protein